MPQKVWRKTTQNRLQKRAKTGIECTKHEQGDQGMHVQRASVAPVQSFAMQHRSADATKCPGFNHTAAHVASISHNRTSASAVDTGVRCEIGRSMSAAVSSRGSKGCFSALGCWEVGFYCDTWGKHDSQLICLKIWITHANSAAWGVKRHCSVSALGYREDGFIGKHGQNPKLV